MLMRPTAAEKTSQEHVSMHRRILCDVIDNKQQSNFALGGRNRSMQRLEALLFSFTQQRESRKQFRLFRDLDQMEADRSCIGGMPFFIYFYALPRPLRAYRRFKCLSLGQSIALEEETRSHHRANSMFYATNPIAPGTARAPSPSWAS